MIFNDKMLPYTPQENSLLIEYDDSEIHNYPYQKKETELEKKNKEIRKRLGIKDWN